MTAKTKSNTDDGNVDLLIVGAGPLGCVVAERAANILGWRSLIVEKRSHIAGNCYDRLHESGVLIHQYGPHYFRTNSKLLLDYLSQFTTWIPGDYRVAVHYKNHLYPFPINLETLSMFFGKDLTPESAETLLAEKRIPTAQPKNSEEFILSRVGKELYEAFYFGYTLKQWGVPPSALDPSVCGRVPIRLNCDDRYVDHQFQLMPEFGFTKMFERMISSPLIQVQLNTNFKDLRSTLRPRKATVYCGPIDEYFDYRLGRLPWRSLAFEFKFMKKEFHQACVQINYPNDFEYTRAVEIKHVTNQRHPNTVVSYEYPKAEGDPYYPIPAEANRTLYDKYFELSQVERKSRNVFFAGRLAEYKYMDTDQAIEKGLKLFEELQVL